VSASPAQNAAASGPRDRHAAAARLLDGGKRVGDAAYMHVSLLEEQSGAVRDLVMAAAALAPDADGRFSVVRIGLRRPEIGLLDYPAFFEEPFPALCASWLVDLDTGRVSAVDFSNRDNPPILHRKELLLPTQHPEHARFARLTAALEDYGAFEQPAHTIGQRLHWARALASLGLKVENHQVVVGSEEIGAGGGSGGIARHRTAISRSRLSTPMRALAQLGYLDGSPTVLDYGCGRGDDVRTLCTAGVRATGWDPHFAPEAPRQPAEVVNLGFVLNVIEDPDERSAALRAAYALTRRVLSVAVMLTGKGGGAEHADGVLTTRRTFQKYFGQAELRAYVAGVVGREPVTVGPGLVFVFRSDEEEQAFLARRQRSTAPGVVDRFELPLAPAEPRRGSSSTYARHQDLLDAFWAAALELGRLPEVDEFERGEELRTPLGSPRRAFAALPHPDKQAQLARAAERRSDDMLVYLALNLFDRRTSLRSLPPSVQRDIRALFGSHKAALERAQAALLAAGDQGLTAAAAAAGTSTGDGVLDAGDGDYTFHVALLERQPAPLRILLGCAERLEPLPADADLVKVHGSGDRVSYLAFEGFQERALPTLARRTVVDLRRRRVSEVPVDTTDGRRVLLGKASLMPVGMNGRDRQERFDDGLRVRGVFTQPGLGPGLRVLTRRLVEAGMITGGGSATGKPC
jgi:DNA phosphorothioation-associated putative methyltransferase